MSEGAARSVRRWTLAAALVVAGVSAAPAQAPKVDRIDVLRPGIYQIEVRGAIEDKSVTTGNRVEAKAYKNLKVTTLIPAKLDTVIGLELVIVGAPRRAKVPLKMVWRYPEPGLLNPQTGLAKTSDEYSNTQQVGEPFPVFWGLMQEWELVPGVWTLEVWHGNRKLAAQEFNIVKP